ncbi:MAG TPA: hypothetical protein VFH61_18600 [Thermoleophilia bacterium]|nr:hypothetical protein [Thermoleophilia bacterium]
MTVTRTELMVRGARRLGAAVGTIASGSATTAVLTGLINQTGDDTSYRGHRLIMPDATAETDKERFIDIWEDAPGRAHFAARTVDTALADETYIVSPRQDYALVEYRDALNVALRETGRTYRYALAIAPGQRVVPLTALTWLLGGGSVDAAWVSDCPNLLHNSDFGLWNNGPASAPDGWTLAGAGSTVARVAGTHSPYGVSLTRLANDATFTQSIPVAVREYLTRSANAPLTPLIANAWVKSATASIARVGISNGATTTWSSYHSGTSGLPELLTVSYTPTATDTDLALVLSVDTSDGEATFLFAGMVADTTFPEELRDYGDSAYRENEVPYSIRNVGGQPAIELQSTGPDLQLIVYSRRPYAALTADTDTVDEQHARSLEAGMLSKLLQVRKPNQDRTRLDVIEAEESRIWTRLTSNFNSLPVPKPLRQRRIVGA